MHSGRPCEELNGALCKGRGSTYTHLITASETWPSHVQCATVPISFGQKKGHPLILFITYKNLSPWLHVSRLWMPLLHSHEINVMQGCNSSEWPFIIETSLMLFKSLHSSLASGTPNPRSVSISGFQKEEQTRLFDGVEEV